MQIRRAPGTVFLNPVASPSSATLWIYDPVRLFPGQWVREEKGKGLRDYRDRWISLQRVWKRNAFLLSKKIVIIACSTFLFEKFESIGEIILEINFHYGSTREREESKRKFSYDITSQLHLIRRVSTNTLFGIGILIVRPGNNQIRLTTNFNNFKLLIRLNLIIESFWISSKTGVSNFSNSKDNAISERHGGSPVNIGTRGFETRIRKFRIGSGSRKDLDSYDIGIIEVSKKIVFRDEFYFEY